MPIPERFLDELTERCDIVDPQDNIRGVHGYLAVRNGNTAEFTDQSSNGTYLNGLESLVKTMIKAATSDDTSYTLESIYNKAP